MFKKNQKRIPRGNHRVIKIDKEAIYEFIRESLIDNESCFFDIDYNKDKSSPIVTQCMMDWEKGEFICVASNCPDGYFESAFIADEDVEFLLSNLENTTNTLYKENRYIELSDEEIQNLKNE